VARIVFGYGSNIQDDDLSILHVPSEFGLRNGSKRATVAHKRLNQRPDLRQPRFTGDAQRRPESQNVIVGEAIVNVVPSAGCLNQPALSQHLEML
jgi:hypothetical protein